MSVAIWFTPRKAKHMSTRLQQGRFGACAAAWRGRVYLFGGTTPEGYTGNVEVINPEAEKCAPLPLKTLPRRYAGAATLGDNIYIVGGANGDGYSKVLEQVDPATGKVQKCRPAPSEHVNAVVVTANDLLWVIGGATSGGYTGVLEIYDPRRDTWEAGPPMPTPRECAGVVHNGIIHVMGGYAGDSGMRLWDTYVISQGRWIRRADMPNAISAHHMAVVGDAAYAFGDYAKMDSVRACDLRTGSWFLPRLPEPFTPRRHAAVTATGNVIVVAGGNIAGSNSYIDTVQIFQL